MRSKHPKRKKVITPLTEAQLAADRKGVDRDVLEEELRRLKHDVAPGLGCLRNEHLLAIMLNPDRQMTPSAANAVDNLWEYANAVVRVEMPDYFYIAWVACRLVPANKLDPADLPPGTVPDCRPVNIGGAERRLITRAYFDMKLQDSYNVILGPEQNGVSIRGGISITAFGVQAVLDSRPDFGVLGGDIRNGYNEIEREEIMNEIKEGEELQCTMVFSQALLEPLAYVGMGSGTGLVVAPFLVEDGVHQGAIGSSWFFSVGCRKAFRRLNERLAESDGGVMAIIDDNYLLGPPQAIFPANEIFAQDLAEVGLELQPAKSQCYIAEEYRNEEWDNLRGSIPNGILKGSDDAPIHGITVCNVPVGSREFVEGYLSQKAKKIKAGFQKVANLLYPGRWPHPEIPCRQMLWILTLVCFQFMGDYWLRHVRPDYTEDFAREVDSGVSSLFTTCVGMNVSAWSDIARERIRLPIKFKGCGLREALDRRYGQFIGAMVQSTLPLLDWTDSNNNIIPGRLNIQPLITLFGEGSFNTPVESPWETLLQQSGPSGNLAAGLQYSWSHLTSSFQDVAAPEQLSDDNLLLRQDVKHAGFYPNGTFAPSVTNALTVELEGARCKDLELRINESQDRDHFERWSWEAWSKMSAVFLHSPPDQFGYIEDPIFQVVMACYLGQPCPIIAPVVGRFFGEKGAKLDKYGANLGAASLPGQGHCALHHKIQSLLQSMMKLGGISSEKEAVNFLLDKVGDPHITAYINHVSSHPNTRKAPYAIVPDLHVHNFPTGRQRVNDSGATTSAEAFLEIKTYTACNTRYKHNNEKKKPAERRAREVTLQYSRKFKKLDQVFAADVVGDGSSGTVGPFEAAQSRFHRGQVIPIWAGWFGEIGEDFEKLIKLLAREAASGDDGLTISPPVNTDRKGGAYPIMLQQFRRAMGVTIVTGQAKHKLARLHYVRETAAEAAALCKRHHSDSRWKPSQNGRASWFSQHTPEGYGTFEQFRNGYDFCMN